MRSTRNWACCAADSLTWSALPSPATTLARSPSSSSFALTHPYSCTCACVRACSWCRVRVKVLQVRVRARYGHHLIWKLPLSILVSYNVPEVCTNFLTDGYLRFQSNHQCPLTRIQYIHQPGALSFSYNLDVIADVRKYLQSSSA